MFWNFFWKCRALSWTAHINILEAAGLSDMLVTTYCQTMWCYILRTIIYIVNTVKFSIIINEGKFLWCTVHQILVFWDAVLSSLIDRYQHFFSNLSTKLHRVTSQKTMTLICANYLQHFIWSLGVRNHNIDHAGEVYTRGILFDAAQELPKNCVTPESGYMYI
jgi:hypothetical protein